MYTDPIKLAQEIADVLNDPDALPLYEKYTRQFSEEFLRKTLKKVLSIPEEKIKRTRGALFTYLVNNRMNNGSRHSRD